MTITVQRPAQTPAPTPVDDSERAAFDEAFRTLLRAWHEYEVLKALGAPLEDVFAARGALQRARAELARQRRKPFS